MEMEITDGDIEQILDRAQSAEEITKEEREDCGKFLWHIKYEAIPAERSCLKTNPLLSKPCLTRRGKPHFF